MTLVGRAVPHESARGHVTGTARFTDDLLTQYPGLLHAWPVTAPHAHARVRAISTDAARRLPQVVAVLTEADVPGTGNTGPARLDEPLFPREVMYFGQPVAWVLAETVDAAKQAAAAVVTEYEPQHAILGIEEAIAAGSYLTAPLRLARGDVSRLRSSAVVVEGELSIGGQEHFYLETQAAIATLDPSGAVRVEASTQHPSETQEVVARVLGIPSHRVVVGCLRMGGAFGGKEVQANAFAAIAALGSWVTRRPVRVRLSRALDMALTGKRHPYLARYAAGFSVDGRIEAVQLRLYSDGGWSLDLSEPIMWRSLFHCDNAYHLPAVEAVGRVCRTHKTSQTAFRGFGAPQAMVVIEEVLSHAARKLSLPPEAVRAANLYREGETTHYGQAVADADRLHTAWRDLSRASDLSGRLASVHAFNEGSPHVKRGLALTPAKFGISFTTTHFNQAGALVLIYRDGSVQVNHGGTEMGQGLTTKIQQIAADGLGLSLDRVRVMPTSTDKVPNTSATAASAGCDLNGAAVADACLTLRGRLGKVAGALLGVEPSAARIEHDAVSGGGRSLSFAELCAAAYRQRVSLFAEGFYRTPGIHFDAVSGQGRPFHYFAIGVAVSEVEVDGFTGQYRLLRTDILQDVGDSVSPVVDRGQVEGGFLQGVGWLTIEDLRWMPDGQLASAGASTYKLPSWSEVPEVFNVRFLAHATQPGVIHGSKAVGEPPLMLAISVREALRAAVAAFGPPDDTTPVGLGCPATPEQVFLAIARVRARKPVVS